MQGANEIPSATNLIAANHDEKRREYADEEGICCFCLSEEKGVPTEDAINHEYFNDYDLMKSQTGHVCSSCAMCMNEGREFKNGSWVATENEFNQFSTGDIKQTIRDIAEGEYDTPYALHVAESPMLSEHAYLWTPISHSTGTITLDFSRRTVTVSHEEFFELIDRVETLRGEGFRLDDIRHLGGRIRDIQNLGKDEYLDQVAALEPYHKSPLFELALKASEKP